MKDEGKNTCLELNTNLFRTTTKPFLKEPRSVKDFKRHTMPSKMSMPLREKCYRRSKGTGNPPAGQASENCHGG